MKQLSGATVMLFAKNVAGMSRSTLSGGFSWDLYREQVDREMLRGHPERPPSVTPRE